jgi:GNAT superfamily N-acetyltransferase
MNSIIIEERPSEATTYYFEVVRGEKKIGRGRLIVAQNSLHNKPFGLLEDIKVEDHLQNQGIGTQLINAIITKAKTLGCYKLIATSRFEREKVHQWYKKLGFIHTSKGFRMNFDYNKL